MWTLVDEVDERNTGEAEANLLSLSYGHIVRRDITSGDGLRPDSYNGYQIVSPGDVIFRFTDLQNDQRSLRSALATERGIITSAYAHTRARLTSLNPQFFAYVMRALDQRKMFYEFGSGVRQTLKFSDLASLQIPLPTLEIQQRIVAYLDAETAEMDAMSERLDELVETLGERRTSLITRGLGTDRSAPIGLVCRLGAGGTPTSTEPRYWTDSGTPWVAISDMSRVEAVSETAKTLTLEGLEASRLTPGAPGTVLFAMYASVGETAVLETEAVWNQAILGLTPSDPTVLLPRFLYLAMTALKPQLPPLFRSNTQNNLNAEQVKSLRIPLPPLDEQIRIVARLDEETAKIDAMIADARKLQALIAERRSALITEVVTGRKEV